jgi:hypothetical protein
MKHEKPKARSAIRWGMQLMGKARKFRHRADRRPKDARREREARDEG